MSSSCDCCRWSIGVSLHRVVRAAVLDRRHQRFEVVSEGLAQFPLDGQHVLERALVARAPRQPQVHAELALVVVGHEFLADVGVEQDGRNGDYARDRQHPPAVRHRPLEQEAVLPVDPRVGAAVLRVRLVPLLRIGRPQPIGAQGRRQREGDEHRQQDRRRRRDAEAEEVAADLARHERHGQEDHDERQRRGHNRQADLPGGLDGRLPRRGALLLDVAEDVLEDDDRVVDDDARRQRQREHRHVVQRESQRLHHREGADDRHRDGEPGNQRHAKVPDEQEHDDGRQQAADEQVVLDFLERFPDEDRLVARSAAR